jgi:hypothetical protein
MAAGRLTLEELKREIAADTIDTVIAGSEWGIPS